MRHRDKLIVAGVLLVVVGAVSWVVFQLTWPAPPIVVSKETTWLTEPLADDGLPDYAGYLLARQKEGVTPENNGAIPFLEAMWPAGLEPGEQQVVCKELGMEVPAGEGMDSPIGDERLKKSLADWLAEADSETDVDPLDYVSWAWYQPWRTDEIPPLATWVDSYESEFALLHQAAARSAFYAPSPTLLVAPKSNLVNVLLTSEQTMYDAVKCLHLRGMRSVGEGHLDKAYEDVEAQLRLSRHLKGSFLVGQMVSIGMENFANQLALWILNDEQLDLEMSRKLLASYRDLPVRDAISREVDQGERLMLPSVMLTMSGKRIDPEPEVENEFDEIAGVPGMRSIDWNIPLRTSNEWYDRLVDAAATRPYSARAAKFAQLSTQLEAMSGRLSTNRVTVVAAAFISRRSRSETMGEILVSLLLPAVESACYAEDRSNTDRELIIVAAALAVYRLEEGDYPQSLEELVPKLLPEVPVDHFEKKPLVYRRTTDGYLLYSLGPNAKDDGGSDEKRSILEGYQVELEGLANMLENENIVRKLLGRPSAESLEEGHWPSVVAEIPSGADDIAIRLPLPRLKLPLPGFPLPRE